MNKHIQYPSLKLVRYEVNIDTKKHRVTLLAPMANNHRNSIELSVFRSELSDAKYMQQQLLDLGAPVIPDLKVQLARLLSEPARNIIHTTVQAGWHNNQFVTRYGSIPTIDMNAPLLPSDLKDAQIYEFDTSHPLFQKAKKLGSLKNYIKGLERPLTYSRPLTLILASALAAPLADLVGYEGGLAFNLSGPSSTGKTLSLRTNLSTITEPLDTNLASFGDTLGFLLQNHSAFGGACVPYSDPKATREKAGELCDKIQTTTFAFHDGVQRRGLTSERPILSRFAIQLFNTEKPLFEIFRQAGRTFETGDRVRLIDIAISTHHGIFDRVESGSGATAAELAAEVEATITNNYGLLLSKWIEHLRSKEKKALIKRVKNFERQILNIFVEKADPDMLPLQSEQSRMAKSFALIAVAGTIAAKEGLFPVDHRVVIHSTRELFYLAAKQLVEPCNSLEKNIQAFQAYIQDKENHPLVTEGKNADRLKCDHGFRRKEDGKVYLYIRREKIEQFIVDKNYLETVYFPALQERGCLIKPTRGWTSPVQQKGLERQRFVKLRLSKL